MTKLDARKRTELRDSAFAYVDPRGRRRLPIHDESHVRNALARFNQVIFEDETARDRARTRLLRAAKRYGIVPIGFIDGQLRTTGSRNLPTGAVTFLMTDVEASTALVQQLGDGYAKVLGDLRRLIRTAVRRAGGREVDARADEFFAAFPRAVSALAAALAIQQRIGGDAWPPGVDLRVRMGIHSGRPTLTDGGYVGISVHATARICAVAVGGQIILSRAALTAMGDERPAGATIAELGRQALRGLPEPVLLYEVVATA
jgi:class 3 adenylate cyclase